MNNINLVQIAQMHTIVCILAVYVCIMVNVPKPWTVKSYIKKEEVSEAYN